MSIINAVSDFLGLKREQPRTEYDELVEEYCRAQEDFHAAQVNFDNTEPAFRDIAMLELKAKEERLGLLYNQLKLFTK